jgi:hypothetical protein
MITLKEAKARIAAGSTLSRDELSEVLLSPGDMTAGEMTKFSLACPEWVAEQEVRDAEIRAKEQRYLEEEAPLREDLHRLGYPVKWVWDFVNTAQSYPDAIPVLIEHLLRPYTDEVREGIARALSVREARGQAGGAVLDVLGQQRLGVQTRWALANALTIVADRSNIEGIKVLAATETNKDVADRLNRALKTAAKP